MLIKTYTVRLIAPDLLQALAVDSWAKNITANSLPSAWAKFVKQKKAGIYRFGAASLAADYDVSLLKTESR